MPKKPAAMRSIMVDKIASVTQACGLSQELRVSSEIPCEEGVVLVVEHTEGGAFGLVLNRPSESTVGEASPELAALIGSEHVLHIGGPVQPNAVTAIGEHAETEAASKLIVGSVGMVDSGGCASSPATPAGERDSWTTRSSRRPGSSPTRIPTTPSRTATSGLECWSGWGTSSRCWRGCRATPR